MKIFMTALCLMILPCLAIAQKEVAPSIQSLKPFVDDQVALVDAARRYQRLQSSLNDWDFDIFQDYKGDDIKKVRVMLSEKIKKRNDAIRQTWEYVLSIYPENAEALNFFGEYWYDIGGNRTTAVKHWKHALVLNGDLSLAHNNLAVHYFHEGEPRIGLFHLLETLELEPENPDYLYNAAQLFLTFFPVIMKELNLDKEAVYRKAMQYSKNAAEYLPGDFFLQRDYATNFYAAENFQVEADWPKAAQAWKDTYALATRNNDLFYARLNEGRCWIRANKKDEAIEALEAAIVLNPSSKAAPKLLEKLRQPDEAASKPKSNINVKSTTTKDERDR